MINSYISNPQAHSPQEWETFLMCFATQFFKLLFLLWGWILVWFGSCFGLGCYCLQRLICWSVSRSWGRHIFLFWILTIIFGRVCGKLALCRCGCYRHDAPGIQFWRPSSTGLFEQSTAHLALFFDRWASMIPLLCRNAPAANTLWFSASACLAVVGLLGLMLLKCNTRCCLI